MVQLLANIELQMSTLQRVMHMMTRLLKRSGVKAQYKEKPFPKLPSCFSPFLLTIGVSPWKLWNPTAGAVHASVAVKPSTLLVTLSWTNGNIKWNATKLNSDRNEDLLVKLVKSSIVLNFSLESLQTLPPLPRKNLPLSVMIWNIL